MVSCGKGVPIVSYPFFETDEGREITAALGGDGEAYRRLVQRYQAEIGQQMRRFSRHPVVLEEVTHDVFVEAYFSLRSYQGSAPFLHWLRKIAVRVGYRYWRKHKTPPNETTLSEDDWRLIRCSLSIPGETSVASELVHALLARLAPSDRLIISLLYLDRCTIAEAAERAGWSIVGTKVRAFRARNRLRKLLESASS